MTLFVGTSGWAYPEWQTKVSPDGTVTQPGFYPPDLRRNAFLDHYSRTLGACEINATFYRLQSPATFTRWAAAVPSSFRFATKAHRRLTHGRDLAPDDGSFLEAFVASVRGLGELLGVVLFQFPPRRARDDAALARLLDGLPNGLRFACEFRHDSWDDADVFEAIAGRGGTVCVSETAGDGGRELPPGPIAYVRLRADRYSAEARASWLERLRNEGATRDVYAFAKHEGIPADDPYGGVGLASWMNERVKVDA